MVQIYGCITVEGENDVSYRQNDVLIPESSYIRFKMCIRDSHSSLETAMQRHADQQKFIRDTMFLDTELANSQMITEEIIHQQTLSSIWATMTLSLIHI